jgi:hypothetical protein
VLYRSIQLPEKMMRTLKIKTLAVISVSGLLAVAFAFAAQNRDQDEAAMQNSG